MGEIKIRHAEKGDIETLVTFNCAMALETENKILEHDVVLKGVTTLLNNRTLGFYLVAEVDSKIVGALMITNEWSDWRNGLFWWIQSVYVDPHYRRQGIYRNLYNHTKLLASEESNICGFRLYVEQDNETAQKTYTSMGMQKSVYRIFEEVIT